MRYLLLFLLSGCAANQSALPLPPEFSPTEDAPIFIGHPGTTAPEPEKSPHRRLLPQTPASRREAGIWAGDEPKQAAPRPALKIGVTAFPPAEVLDATVSPACVQRVNVLLDQTGKRELFERLIEPVQRCIAATLHRDCIAFGIKENAKIANANRKQYKLPPLERPKSREETDAERIVNALCTDERVRGPYTHEILTAVGNKFGSYQ